MESTKIVVFKFKEELEKKFNKRIYYSVKSTEVPEIDNVEFYTYDELDYDMSVEGDRTVIASSPAEQFITKAGKVCHWIHRSAVEYHIDIIPTNAKFAIPFDNDFSGFENNDSENVFAKLAKIYSSKPKQPSTSNRVVCDCGAEVAKGSLKAHQKTKKHIERVLNSKTFDVEIDEFDY